MAWPGNGSGPYFYSYGAPEEEERPRFGTYETLTAAQKSILAGLQRGGAAPSYQPVGVGQARMPTAARPTYGAMQLGGAGERSAMLSRMMGVSPGEEAAAIQAMSQPAMRQFREEILPTTRGQQVGAGTAWSTMRAGAEAGAGADLAERLAAMGEQHRMQRRGQAMQAGGLSMQEALGATQAGLTRYGTEMQPYMQAMGMAGQEAMQRQALGMQAGLQAQQLGAQGQMSREQMLAQLLGIPMMGVYSY